ncbi:FidL-like protein [Serratia marcescens]|uniref:FidL-like protein n=1 Tax=Serratia marcescens TaxID=615 RepID=UPI0009360D75|nr:FidL-like protein [Serratia marcescens]
MEVDGEHYNLRRVVFFSLSPSIQKGIKVATVVKEEISVADTTPESFWYNGITPEKPGVDVHIEMKKINQNTILIDSLSIPIFICTKQSG